MIKYSAMLWPSLHSHDTQLSIPSRSMKLSNTLAKTAEVAGIITECEPCTNYYKQDIYHPHYNVTYVNAVNFLTGGK